MSEQKTLTWQDIEAWVESIRAEPPSFKAFEDTYMDGWHDALNEMKNLAYDHLERGNEASLSEHVQHPKA